MWPELISAAAKGFTTYLGNRAQKKAQEEAIGDKCKDWKSNKPLRLNQ